MTIIAEMNGWHIENIRVLDTSAAASAVEVSDLVNVERPGAFMTGMIQFNGAEADTEFINQTTLRTGAGASMNFGDTITNFRLAYFQSDATARTYSFNVLLFIRDFKNP